MGVEGRGGNRCVGGGDGGQVGADEGQQCFPDHYACKVLNRGMEGRIMSWRAVRSRGGGQKGDIAKRGIEKGYSMPMSGRSMPHTTQQRYPASPVNIRVISAGLR